MTPINIQRRLKSAKRSFVTRRAITDNAASLTFQRPEAGDLCLARIDRLGHHSRLELVSGRRAILFPGDEVLLAFGARYATDQFHSVVPEDLSACHMVASGGIASKVISKHSGAKAATRITPVGILADASGNALNLRDFSLATAPPSLDRNPHVICVVGSSMNAGKTTTVSEIGRLAKRQGLRAAAIKLTGTGSGGDVWKYLDSGIPNVFDFTDAGYATTVDLSCSELELAFEVLLGHAKVSAAEIVIVELADGIFQKETASLLASATFRNKIDSIVYAASDPVGGAAGLEHLKRMGLHVAIVSGTVTASEIATRELMNHTEVEVVSLQRFAEDETVFHHCLQNAKFDIRGKLAKTA